MKFEEFNQRFPECKLRVVIHRDTQPKVRKTYCLTGVAPPINIRTFNNTIDAAYTAIVERVLLVKDETCNGMKRPPLPITHHFTKTLDYIVRHFKRTAPFCNPLTHRAYALSFQAPKQQLYLKAVTV
jgi:hypothetical protein